MKATLSIHQTNNHSMTRRQRTQSLALWSLQVLLALLFLLAGCLPAISFLL
jgi:hypothetical protein